jgi:glutaconyl-CoA/methylmalonyl-CoA decarboxylase subunit gamma
MEARRPHRVAPMKFAANVGDVVHEIEVIRRDASYVVTLDGVPHVVDARKREADFYSILYEGKSYEVSVESAGPKYVVRHGANEQVVELADASRGGRDELHKRSGALEIASVMPGKVVRVLVAAGDVVVVGQGLVVVEAMKMENEIAAPRAGTIREVAVTAGATVETGAKLIVME